MAEDLLSRIRGEVQARMRELRPLIDEYEQTLAAADALGLNADAVLAPAARAPRRPRAPRGPGAPRASRAPQTPGAPRASRASQTPSAPRASRASQRPSAPRASRAPVRPERAPRGAAQQAILAALEHGSHTVGELVVVTAMSAPNVRENLRRLLQAGTVTRARREGKAAYALSR